MRNNQSKCGQPKEEEIKVDQTNKEAET